MFPPKVVGIIGNLGQMAINVIEPFFREAGCEVIGSDLKNPDGLTNQQVAERADVLYFSILPISAVAQVMSEVIPFSRPDTLWLHGTSIQQPVRRPISKILQCEELMEKNVTTGFLHFMVGPNVRSLRGQAVIYGFLSEIQWQWKAWLVCELQKKHVSLLQCTPKEHDLLTTASQVVPMLMSLLTSGLWDTEGLPVVRAIAVAGPPCWLQTYGVVRNLSQPTVIANILQNHPQTIPAIRQALLTLEKILQACLAEDTASLVELAEKGYEKIDKHTRKEMMNATTWHIRLEGDLRGGAVRISCPPEKNRLGILTSVLEIFDRYALDKTSCMAQELPDGGCTFYIGLKDIDNPGFLAACKEVTEKLGGQIETVPE